MGRLDRQSTSVEPIEELRIVALQRLTDFEFSLNSLSEVIMRPIAARVHLFKAFDVLLRFFRCRDGRSLGRRHSHRRHEDGV